MGISCQQNGQWAATNHLSGRGLVQPIKKLSSVVGQCALIRQLANAITQLDVHSKLVNISANTLCLSFLHLHARTAIIKQCYCRAYQCCL